MKGSGRIAVNLVKTDHLLPLQEKAGQEPGSGEDADVDKRRPKMTRNNGKIIMDYQGGNQSIDFNAFKAKRVAEAIMRRVEERTEESTWMESCGLVLRNDTADAETANSASASNNGDSLAHTVGTCQQWVTFSQKTKSVPRVKRIIAGLERLGVPESRCFFQENIDVAVNVHWVSVCVFLYSAQHSRFGRDKPFFDSLTPPCSSASTVSDFAMDGADDQLGSGALLGVR